MVIVVYDKQHFCYLQTTGTIQPYAHGTNDEPFATMATGISINQLILILQAKGVKFTKTNSQMIIEFQIRFLTKLLFNSVTNG